MHDLIVIGDDLSSHIAAAVAAGYGLDTALIAPRGTGGIYLLGDFAFNIDPTPLTGFGAAQTWLTLLAELDIPPIEREGRLLNPAYQIILPEHRIDFFNEKEALINEMAREFPEHAREINAFYESAEKKCKIFNEWLHSHPFIQPLNIKDYYNYLKMMPHFMMHQIEKAKFKMLLNHNASLKKVFEAQEALLSYTTGNKYSFSSSFQHCAPFRGIYHFQHGKQIIFNSLIKKLESNNGLYLSSCEVLNINSGNSIEIEIADLAGNSSIISAKNLIVSTKWESMHLLFADKKKIDFGEWISPVTISHLPFTIHLGCPRQCLPEKMACHLAVISDVEKNIFDDNLIILESNIPADEMMPAANKVSLTATVFLPDNPDVWSQDNLAVQASSIIDRLEFFLPFLKENIEFFDLEKSIEISKTSHGVFNPKYKIRNSFITGFAARTNKTRFKNIYLTGASLLADAGFEGEILSGMNAASRVIGRSAKIT
jgi:phytoene dehydrogenase-like protein